MNDKYNLSDEISYLRKNFRNDVKHNFVFLTCLYDENFFINIKNGMNAAAKFLNVNCVFSGSIGLDTESVVKLIYEAVDIGYNGLAIDLIAPEVFDKPVENAVKKGIPVVSFAIDENNNGINKRYSTVSQNFFEAGKILGDKVKKYINPGDSVLFTRHTANVNALEKRKEGILKSLGDIKDKTKIYELVTGNIIEEAVEKLTGFLKSFKDINIIICTGLADTESSGMVVEELSLSCKIFGFDTSVNILNLIKQGYIIYTIDQQAYTQGFYPVIQLFLKANYGFVPYSINAGHALIGEKEVDEIMIESNKGIRY